MDRDGLAIVTPLDLGVLAVVCLTVVLTLSDPLASLGCSKCLFCFFVDFGLAGVLGRLCGLDCDFFILSNLRIANIK